MHFWQHNTPEFTQRFMQIQMNYAMNLMKVGVDFNAALMDSLCQGARTTQSREGNTGDDVTLDCGQSGSDKRPVEAQSNRTPSTDLHCSGAQGDTLRQKFVVSNREARAIEVGFEA